VWHAGETLQSRIGDDRGPATRGWFERAGSLLAELHTHTANWTPPAGFVRHRLDADGLVGKTPFWGRFWEASCLNAEEQKLLSEARELVRARLIELSAPFSLIHADAHAGNILISGDRLFVCYDSGLLGCFSSLSGAIVSALFPRLPSGATIVLCAGAVFGLSLLFGTRRGVIFRAWESWMLGRRIQRQHLLRAMFELGESRGQQAAATPAAVDFSQLMSMRSWSSASLQRELSSAAAAGLVVRLSAKQWRLTASGQQIAARLVHQHRLWELYLITHADVAPSRVDRDADQIEHILTPDMIARLERLLGESQRAGSVPSSPHPIVPPVEGLGAGEAAR
jgi:Mn-dependent DtxR family transcriptional regulator